MYENEWNEDIMYKGRKLVKATVFAEKHGIDPSVIYVAFHNGHPHIHKIDKVTYIDEVALELRREFHHKIWNKAHENYYEITEYISTNKLATLLSRYTGVKTSNWGVYMSKYMFSTGWMDKSILNYKMSDNLWAFFRFSTFLVRRLTRYEEQRQAAIYARLPNRDEYEKYYTREQKQWFEV